MSPHLSQAPAQSTGRRINVVPGREQNGKTGYGLFLSPVSPTLFHQRSIVEASLL
jgi:hypothetical protein